MRRKKLYGPKHFDVLVSMHNLSMTHHVAGREDEAVKLQEEIARIGEEMGLTAEEQSEASGAAGGPVKLAHEEGKSPGKNHKKKDSGATWKPMHTRSRRKSKRK